MEVEFNNYDEILAHLNELDNSSKIKVLNLKKCIFSFNLELDTLFHVLRDRYSEFQSLDFRNSIFKYPLNLNLYQNLVTDRSSNLISFKYSKTKIDFNLDFSKCHFLDTVDFNGIEFNQDLNFIGTTFEKRVTFSELVFHNYLRLFNASFNDDVYFAHLELNNKSIFFSGIEKRTKFEGNLHFQDVIFSMAKFWHFVFKKNVYFLNTVFDCPVYFNDSSFLGEAYFSSLETMGLTKFNDKVYFDNAVINELKLERLTFDKAVSFNFATINHISIDNVNCVDSTLSLVGTKLDVVKDEGTARFLKSEAIKSNNPFLIAELNAKEMTMHYKGLGWKKDFFDKFIFFLNKNSTNFGKKWEKGVLFIFLSWVFSFSIIVMLRDGIGTRFIWVDKSYLKEAVDFLWNFGDLDVLGYSISWWDILIFVIGKIFIAYGVYQTIAAFRKYGRK